jgi:hypothetical protein
VKRLRGLMVACAVGAALLAMLPATALGMPPLLNADVSATMSAPGWYNVPITWTFHDVVWDNPITGSDFDISRIDYSKDGKPCVSVVPTSTLELCDQGRYALQVTFASGELGYDPGPVPMEFGIDWTPPTSTSDVKASYQTMAHVSIMTSDALSGPGWVCYRLDGAAEVTATVSESSPTVAVNVGVGTHSLAWTAYDAAGNAEVAPHAVSFTVSPEVTAPRVYAPHVRVRGKHVTFSGTMTRVAHASTLTFVVKRRNHGRWQIAARFSVRVSAGSVRYAASRVLGRSGEYRVCARLASGPASPATHFRR